MKERVTGAVETARPYADRIAHDEEFQKHMKAAYESARGIYDDVFGGRGATGVAARVARDKDLQNELRNTVQELRLAGERVQAKESHTARNATILLAGIVLGVLFNPATGPETRRWLKDKVFGPEQPFEYQTNES
jgi:hypothetical protein